ncbi:MAG TPA: hypothetical protein VFJ74_06260, partial [Gemmatimonadaceae bacterium]|nr:hypothetical protein [Gemmatimonadaceae bacterium]
MSQGRRGGESEAAAGSSTPPAGARRVTPVDVDAPMGATAERRRVERRGNIRVADLSLPELRRMMVTSVLSALVLVLFLWMVRGVLIAAILGVVMAAYMRPVFEWVRRGVRSSSGAALLTLGLLLIPVAAALAYSYLEVVRVARYLAGHEHEIATQIDRALSRFAIVGRPDTSAAVERWVIAASNYGASLP